MSKPGPLDHVARQPLPWRTEAQLTECGKEIADLDPDRVITIDELFARIRRLGQMRSAYTTCMTCFEAARRNRSDRPDGVATVAREIHALRWVAGVTDLQFVQRDDPIAERRRRLAIEMDAIAALVAAHREEFDGFLAGREETVSLDEQRARRAATRRKP